MRYLNFLIALLVSFVSTSLCVFAENPQNITINECTAVNRVVTISGTVTTDSQNESVVVVVLEKGKTEDDLESIDLENINTVIKYFSQQKLSADGSFRFSYKMRGETGDYTVLIDSKALSDTYTAVLSFTNTLWTEFKALKDDTSDGAPAAFRTFIENEAYSLGIDLSEYNDISETSKIDVCESLRAYTEDYTSDNFPIEWEKGIVWSFIEDKNCEIEFISDMVDNKISVGSTLFDQPWVTFFADNFSEQSKLNLYNSILSDEQCNDLEIFTQMMQDNLVIVYVHSAEYWKDLYTIIEAENNALGFNAISLSVFNTLLDKDAVVNALYIQGQSKNTSAEIISLFDTLVSAQKTKESKPVSTPKPKPSGGGGGSWSVGIPTVTPKPTITPEPTPPTEPELQKPAVSVFNDIEDVEWAHEAIDYLSGKGILSGVGEGRFEPNRYMTREELVKMMDNAFNFAKEEAESNFADADKNAWYYSAVSAAAKKGIVTGYGNNTFGIGKLITREDAAVIFLRAAGKENFKTSADVSFSDKEAVSDYAKEAVGTLGNSGIISGMGDGCFMPKSNLTRAEAAKMFYGLLMQIEA